MFQEMKEGKYDPFFDESQEKQILFDLLDISRNDGLKQDPYFPQNKSRKNTYYFNYSMQPKIKEGK